MNDFPVPFRHAIAAVDATGKCLWEQGEIGGVFPLASLTKVITALGAATAVQQGKLAFDYPAGPPGATLRHLLSHASGLASEGGGSVVVAPPGSKRIYSNQGFDVIGDLIEKTTKTTFLHWMQDQVYDPLGLEQVTVPGSPASSGWGTAVDLSVLIEEFLDPQLLSPDLLAEMTTVSFPGLRGILPGYGMQEDNCWGLGVEIKGHKQPHWTPSEASADTFGHFGVLGSALWVDPRRRIGVAFLGDEPFGQWHKENWPRLGSRIIASLS